MKSGRMRRFTTRIFMSFNENPNKPVEKVEAKEKPPVDNRKNRDVLKVNLGKSRTRSFAELKKGVDERSKTVKTVGGVLGNSEDFLAMADAKIDEKDDKMKIDLDFAKLNKGMDGKEVKLTELFTPDFKELNVGGKAYTRGMKDGKLAYYSKDGKEVPMGALKGKMSFDFSESQMLDMTRAEVEEMVRQEMVFDFRKAMIQQEGRAQRYGSMDQMATGGGGGERMSPSSYASVAPSRAPRNFQKFEQGVAPEENTFDVNQTARDFLQNWERKYPDYMRNQKPTAQRIESRSAKMAYVRDFQQKDIPNAVKFGWSGDKQNRPLMITRDRTAYFFVPKTEGQKIDLNNPDTFDLLRMPVSMGKGGYGNVPSSEQTPTGLLEATGIQETGPRASDGINVYRVFLDGRNTEQNGEFVENTNSNGRGIRVHQQNLDTASHGCIRMGSLETIFLASQVKQFGSVFINVSPNGVDEAPVQMALATEQAPKKV